MLCFSFKKIEKPQSLIPPSRVCSKWGTVPSIDIFCHLLNVKFWKCYKTFLSNFKMELQITPRGAYWISPDKL